MRYLPKFFWDIPGIFVHKFQLTLNFLFVCQSVSWLIFLFETFLSLFDTCLGCVYTISKWLRISCFSVSLLFSLILYWNHTNIDNFRLGWDIFLKFLGDTLGTLIHYFQIILIFCMSVSLLVGYFLTEIRQIWGYLNF